MVAARTRLTSQMRAFCLQYGIPLQFGASVFKIDLPRAIADDTNGLTTVMRELPNDHFDELKDFGQRIAKITPGFRLDCSAL